MTAGVEVRPVGDADQALWAAMRQALWPDCDPADHVDDIAAICAAGPLGAFIAWQDGTAVGFAEAAVRSHVDGSPTVGAAFLEGIWVAPSARGTGVAAALLAAVEAWGMAQGCVALGSDALLDNKASHAWHAACGFEEVERAVRYIKPIRS